MSKSKLITIIIIFILLALGGFWYFNSQKNTGGAGQENTFTNFFASFNPFAKITNKSTDGGNFVDVDSNGVEDTSENKSKEKFFRLSSSPVSGYTVFNRERYLDLTKEGKAEDSLDDEIKNLDTLDSSINTGADLSAPTTEFAPMVRYAEKITGNIYQTFADAVSERKYSSTVVKGVHETMFGEGGKMAAALRRLGFDFVFDTDFAADLTIMEEGAELLDRLGRYLKGEENVKLPMLTSCCPGWVNFFEHNFPDLLDVPSTAKSPQQMFGAIAKSYFADKIGVDRKNLVVVSVMPCLAKKYECQRDEFKVNGNPDVDFSISTRELAHFIKQANIDFLELPDEDFDNPLGESTGAGVIFGITGGVIEAACRTAYELHTGKSLEKLEFSNLRGMDGIRSATIDFDGLPLNIGIAHGLANARKLLNEVREGRSKYHAIEIMACPGGCIGGGGQPYHFGNSEILLKRGASLYSEDERKVIRKSHENPQIIRLYEEFLGKPLGHKSHELLHTHYFDKSDEVAIHHD